MSNALNLHIANKAKVIETEHFMLLMTNQYDKETLAPASMFGMSMAGATLGNNVLNIKTHMTITQGHRTGLRHHNMGIIKDPYMDHRYYILLNGHYANVNADYPLLCFLHDTGDDVYTVRNVSIRYMEWENIVDIDDTFLYLSARYQSNNYAYIYRVNKHDGSVTELFHIGGSRNISNLIYKDETYLYFITRSSSAYWVLTRINKSTAEVKSKNIYAPTMNAGAVQYPYNNSNLWMGSNMVTHENFYSEKGKYYWIMPQKSGAKFDNDGNANNNIAAWCFNPALSFEDANIVTYHSINIQNNSELQWFGGNGYIVYRTWVKNGFLYYAIYDESNGYTDMIPIQGIHKFKIKPGFDLEWVSVNRISTSKEIVSMVFNSDKTRVLIGYYGSFDILQYNEETGDYESTNKEVVEVTDAGFDALDRLWYMHSDTSVHVQNVDDPQEVVMNFEHVHYTYEGTNIESYMTFEAKAFDNSIPVGKYVFQLAGNAFFNESNSSTLEIQYSGGVRKLPLTITGPKRVTCYVEFVKKW